VRLKLVDCSSEKLSVTDLMEYIRIQWTDIHHTRNQEWKVLVIIVGIFYALFKISPTDIWLHVAITILGLIACGMGIYMNLAHWLIFYSKMQGIAACERKLGIEANFFKPPLPVQGLILLVYFFIASILSGWLIWLLVKNHWISFITFIVCFLVGFIVSLIAKTKIQSKINREPSIIFGEIGGKK